MTATREAPRTLKTKDTPKEARRIRRFEFRIGLISSGGKFCDGWILGAIGVALQTASVSLDMSVFWEGLTAASSLIGIFLGGLIFGWVTDRIGRKKVFIITLAAFIICSVAQYFVVNEEQLFTLRLIMGIAIGADYTVAGAMIAEFVSRKKRGPYLAGLIAWWYTGFVVGATASLLLTELFATNSEIWRWILLSSALPAAVILLARIGVPETPRWLALHGRHADAVEVANKYVSAASCADVFEEENEDLGFTALFSKAYIRRTLLTSIFWFAQVAPFFAIFTFLDSVLEGLGIHAEGAYEEIVFYLLLLLGSYGGVLIVNKIGRRPLLIYTFVGMALSMIVLGLWADASMGIVITCFVIFAVLNSLGGVLQTLYPSEIFPTAIRATGIGFSAAMSRIGAAVGTFFLPLALSSWGTGPVMLISAGILLVGLIVSVLWAPETTGVELSVASRQRENLA